MRVAVRPGRSAGLVEFDSPHGSAAAKWAGAEPLPSGGTEVELEIDDALIWAEHVHPAAERTPRLVLRDGQVELVGLVEADLGDDLFSVRLGNSVVTLEIEAVPDGLPGQWISVVVEPGALELYPYSV
ncbi:hypothetical protein ACPZ19_37075 [Amycolatopsis lurida]